MRTSHSKIKTWRRCHKAYDYKYNQKLRPKKKGIPLLFGSLVHEMIEADANKQDPDTILETYRKEHAKAFREEREVHEEFIKMVSDVMKGYFLYYANDPIKYLQHKKTKKRAEHEFEYEIAKGVIVVMKLDGVGATKDKRTWLVEHKTGQIPDEGVRYRDTQTALYAPVPAMMGFPEVDGICWNYIRRKAPAWPEVLKNGRLSERKNIDTTPAVYLEAIREAGHDPRDYKEILETLRGKESNFYKRVFMPVNPKMAKQLMADLVETADEIEERAKIDHTRNITRDCSFCEYEGLCRAELMGLDTDIIRRKDYEVSQRK